MKINKMFVNGNIINITSNDEKVSKYKSNKTKPIIEKTLDATNITGLDMNSLDTHVYVSSRDINQIIVKVYSSNSNNLCVSLSRDTSLFGSHTASIIVKKHYNNSIKNNYSIVTDNSLKIEVVIPNKLFDYIDIKSTNGNITIDSSIACLTLKLTSTNGNITTNCPFEHANINSINGDVTIQICATTNSLLHVKTTNGDINITLSNFWKNDIKVYSSYGFLETFIVPLMDITYMDQYLLCSVIFTSNNF